MNLVQVTYFALDECCKVTLDFSSWLKRKASLSQLWWVDRMSNVQAVGGSREQDLGTGGRQREEELIMQFYKSRER